MNEFTFQLRLTKFIRFFKYGIYCLLFLVGHLMFGQAVGTIQIGSGTTTTTGGSITIPITNYNYSYSQQIVTSAEYSAGGGVAGNITKLRYKLNTAGTFTVWNDLKIYIANTPKTEFLSNTDWVPFSDLTEVFNGVITPEPTGGQWFEITFSTPFAYTGGNIVIAVHDNTPGWLSAPSFFTYVSTANSGIVWRYDPSNTDPSTESLTATGRTAILPQIQFVGSLANCLAPTNIQVSPTVNGGTLSWTPNSNAVSHDWIVVANNAGSGAAPLASGVGAISSALISGLNPATEYDVYVKTNCTAGDGISAWSSKFDFVTSCATITADFTQNFDTTTVGTTTNPSPPQCWSFIDDGAGYGYTYNATALSPSNCFYIYNAGDVTGDYILVGPETDNLGNGTKQLHFFARAGGTAYSMTVGTMSDPTQGSTFTPLANGELTLGTTYQEFVFLLPPGTNDYFAFRHGQNGTFQSIYIDDVSYETPPLCSGVSLGSLTATEITNTQAKLSWNSLSTDFDIEYGPQGFTQGTGTMLTNVTNDYVLPGLTQATAYSYYVRANCGLDGVTLWSGPFNFTTQTVVPSPWFEGFSSTMPAGFTINGFSLSNTVAALAPSNGYYYYRNIYNTNTTGGGVTTLNVGPILTGDKLSFDYIYANWSTGDPTDSDEGVLEVQISTDFGVTYQTLVNIPSDGVGGWQNYQTELSAYLGQIVKIKFIGHWDEVLDGDFYLGLDSFYIGSCELPSTPEVTNTTINSVTLNWVANATDTFEIEYGLTGFTQGTGTIVSATGSSVTIGNLTDASNYEYYIRKTCGTGNSPWVGKYKFSTSCNVFTAGFIENFDTTVVGSSTNPTVPVCWTFLDGGVGYGYVSSSSSSSSPNSFYIYDNGDNANSYILVSPETQNLNDGTYRVKFKARGATGYKLKFGTMSNKLDPSTFTQLQEYNLTATYQEFVVYLPVGTNDYFAFKHGQAGTFQSIYIDDVIYEPVPDCVEPVSLGATPNLLDFSANLTWSGPDVITNNNFEIEWGIAGFVQGSGTIVAATTYSTLLTNLVEGESYSFYVRRICANENTVWVGPYTFVVDYCESDFGTFDGDGIVGITIGTDVLDYTLDLTYQSIDNSGILMNSQIPVDIALNFETGFNTGYAVYIDFGNDGFDASDLVSNGYNTLGEGITTSAIILPDGGDFVTGDYQMRIVTQYGVQIPNPCAIGSWGQTFDLSVHITFPCVQPSDLEFVDVGFDYVTLEWVGQGTTNFEIEYGLTGFTQGSGTVIQNVNKPYTVNNLTPGSTYDFYIRKKCGNLFSDWSAVATTYVFCDTPEPTGASSQTLVQDELLSDLVIVGQNLKFYTDPDLTQEVPVSTVLDVSGTYFVTQTINCESDAFLIVDVTVIPRIDEPIVNPNQNFCNGGTLADVIVNSLPGATLIWYQDAVSINALPLTTVLTTATYYVVQTDGITTSHRVAVNVTVDPIPVDLVAETVHLCGNYTFGNLTINNLPGTIVRWYVSATETTPIGNNVPVSTGTYYATQAFGICESQRVAYQISQFESLNKPIAATQNFCGNGTVADLVADGVSGAQMLWYSSASAVNTLSSATALSTGTYYVAQTINGCLSERRAVAVRVVSIAAPQVAPFTICGSGTVSDLQISAGADISFRWYNSPSSTDELLQTTPLTHGTYFVERVQYGCVSARTAVEVTIGTIPNAPTGIATQTFIEGSTVANLIMNQANVVWYATFNDSQNGVNPLLPTTLLENGSTYYAVIIGTNGCPSLPFAVTVNVFLSNNEFDKEGLKYYPNPVNDVLNIDYVESIKFVEVFDLLGKRVKTLNTNNENIQIDLSDLASGTYMIQLKTDTKTQFIKIIKK